MSTSLEIKLNLSRTLKTSIFWQSRTPLTSYTLYRRAWHLHVHTFSAFISSQHLTCQPLTPLWLFSPRWDHTAVQTEGFSSHPPGHTHAHTCQHTCTQPTHHPPPPRELSLSWLPHTARSAHNLVPPTYPYIHWTVVFPGGSFLTSRSECMSPPAIPLCRLSNPNVTGTPRIRCHGLAAKASN